MQKSVKIIHADRKQTIHYICRRFFGIIIGLSVVFWLFVLSPIYPYAKSLTVMKAYSSYLEHESFLEDVGITIQMPGGLRTPQSDWYPFVMTFNDDKGFSRYIDQDVRLSILYNFGAFELTKGASTYYAPSSPYFNSFYGVYAIYEDSSKINLKRLEEVTAFDMKTLVLESIGCTSPQMDFTIQSIQENVALGEYSDWTLVNADILVNSPVHFYTKDNPDYQAYIQYGRPPLTYFEGQSYPLVQMLGRIYVRYFEKEKTTIGLYVIGTSPEMIQKTVQDFLDQTKISTHSDNRGGFLDEQK